VNGQNIDMLYRRLYDVQGPYFGGLVAFLPGCNMKCWYCGLPFLWKTPLSNYQDTLESELVDQVSSLGCGGVCLFGGEPGLHHEYVLEVARLCRQKGLETILTTNGFISPWLAQLYATAIDYPVVGIKGSGSPRLYADMSADPKICLQTARILWQGNKRTHITDLIGPGLKYTEQDDQEFAAWVCENISSDVIVRLECLKEPAPSSDLTIPLRPIGGDSDATTRAFETAKRFQDAGLRDVELPLSLGPQIY
jgi:pyruvate formate lyase activating enzyme